VHSTTLTEEAAERLRRGVTWARREDIVRTDGELEPGETTILRDPAGGALGLGDVDLEAQPPIRRIALPDEDPQGVVARHLRTAMERRLALVDDPRYCRLVHDDADGLPGLIIDRYERHYVVQALTRAMEARAPAVARNLMEVSGAESILLRRDGPARARAGLPLARPHVLLGTPPRWTRVLELGARITTDLFEGPSVGYPYMLRETRRMLQRLCGGARVLDVNGGIGHLFIHAGRSGAKQILAFTADEGEAELARENVEANGLLSRVAVHAGTSPQVLAGVDDHFDVVLVDARELDAGALSRMLRAAMRLTRHRGRLVVAASHPALPPGTFEPTIAEAAERQGRICVRLVQRSAPEDFPVLISPSMGESLTAFALEVI
jgi:23S rRNA (cytosine1962-C5)-methyltransferase